MCRGVLTSGTSWTVPNDWNNASNTVELIGGGEGGSGSGSTSFGDGGDGGDYARKSNVSLTLGASIPYSIGAGGTAGGNTTQGGSGGDTTFNGTEIRAPGGGSSSSVVGDVTFTGGIGGNTPNDTNSGGGGGAAGKAGNGGNGGIGGASSATGGAGGAPGAGGDLATEAGPGAGGNGGGNTGTDGSPGSIYGAGGGGARATGFNPRVNNAGGVGAQGLIVITYTPVSAPTVVSNFASNIGAGSATLNGTILSDGGASVTQHGFAYGTSPTLASGVATTTLGAYGGSGLFAGTIGSLLNDTDYYFRAYATNSGGTGYGAIVSFTTGNVTVTRKMRLFEGFRIKLLSGTLKLF